MSRTASFFLCDAENLVQVPGVVLIGTRKDPLKIPACGLCGLVDCDVMIEAGGPCSFNTGDLGIAVGSAAVMAADLLVDNRIMYAAGRSVVGLNMLGDDVAIAYGIHLSAGKRQEPFL